MSESLMIMSLIKKELAKIEAELKTNNDPKLLEHYLKLQRKRIDLIKSGVDA